MKEKINPDDIKIRTKLLPGDIGYITYMHGYLYHKEYNYSIAFETYVAAGLIEFYQHYDLARDCVWICEHQDKIIGSLVLMHRGESAQLRYFILEPAYRGIGLGRKLMNLYMDYLIKSGYKSSYLWTTQELSAAAHLYTRHGFTLTEEKESTALGKLLKEQRYNLIIPE